MRLAGDASARGHRERDGGRRVQLSTERRTPGGASAERRSAGVTAQAGEVVRAEGVHGEPLCGCPDRGLLLRVHGSSLLPRSPRGQRFVTARKKLRRAAAHRPAPTVRSPRGSW
ncbi:hypothetical protein Kpho02_37340 [Kitasatospora phosalacinea]|uniref:Uncharacterized protein n=1 Tax=Kitasatospora phosalacinea TaxID=2065 RepID=A0A9W6V3U0_9ACTN|nr:hypothetical protein Kpho02_37340 [Kitasatospora phosalacinea]